MGDLGDPNDVWNYDAWNFATTVLTFDEQSQTASGVVGEELEGLLAPPKTQITLEKKS